MKDEDKAKELASKYARQYHHNTYPESSGNGEFVFSNEEIEKACLDMAEWKDRQFWSKENIEKIIKTYKSFPDRSCPGELVKKTIEKLKNYGMSHMV